jgi:hypothetical protein
MMIAIAYSFRHNLDEGLIEAGVWSPYNIINTRASVDHEGRRCRPGACTRWIGGRKWVLGVHNDDRDKDDRKLHSTICGNRLDMRYWRVPKSGVGILDMGRFTRALIACSRIRSRTFESNAQFERNKRFIMLSTRSNIGRRGVVGDDMVPAI